MKIRNIISILIVVAMLFAISGCGIEIKRKDFQTDTTPATTPNTTDEPTEPTTSQTEPSADNSECTPLLYKISDEDSSVYLFGSIHIYDERFYPLPDYVMNAYDDSDCVAFEFDVIAFENDIDAQTEALSVMVYTDGSTISDHIDDDVYEDAVEILEENGMYFSYMDYYMPCLWSNMIDQLMYENAGIDLDKDGIDSYLLNCAYEDGKEIVEVESALSQYTMLSEYSAPLQEYLLESSVEYYYGDEDEIAEEIEELKKVWLKGEKEYFAAYLDEEDDDIEDEYERALYEEYYNAMTVERNLHMTNFTKEALEDNENMFICVGAAHLAENGAMVDQLIQQGYTVEEIR